METYLTEEQLSYFRLDLEEKRAKILANLALSSQEVSGCAVMGDETDQASYFQGINTYRSINKQQEQMLEEIEDALKKIKEGTYGECAMCEDHIPIERLKVKPFARYCIGCREVIEKQEGLAK